MKPLCPDSGQLCPAVSMFECRLTIGAVDAVGAIDTVCVTVGAVGHVVWSWAHIACLLVLVRNELSAKGANMETVSLKSWDVERTWGKFYESRKGVMTE